MKHKHTPAEKHPGTHSAVHFFLYAPIGIWALIAMKRPDVRDQFRN